MVIGSLMLFETPGPFMRLSLLVILPAVIMTALFFTIVLGLAYKAYKRKPVTGAEGLIGLEGTVRTDITEDGGMVSLHGELWSAYSDEHVPKGEKVTVEAVKGLMVKVRRSQIIKQKGGD
jgi:membrane-bound serine protease (ClpP class)